MKHIKEKAVLEGSDATALASFYATTNLFGDRWMAWEPETIRMELDDLNIDIRKENFDELMAVVTLCTSTAFFYEVNTFENVCVALNAHSPQFDALHELCPAQVAWGVKQANEIVDAISDHEIPEELSTEERFDYEPVGYTVAACQHAGLITVPDSLSFARDRLENVTCADKKLVSKVKKAWSELDHSRLKEHAYGEDPVGVQLALMATIPMYLEEQWETTQQQIQLLKS